MLLLNKKGEQIVSMAVPIRRFKRRAGRAAAVDAPRPDRQDPARGAHRHPRCWRRLALLASVVTSLLLARTVAGPMRRLSAAAEQREPQHRRAATQLPELADRHDEVGQMAGAFQRHDGGALPAHRGEREIRRRRRARAQEPAHRRALDRRIAGLCQDRRAARSARRANPEGAEAPQPSHHRRLQRLPPRRRACAQGDARRST